MPENERPETGFDASHFEQNEDELTAVEEKLISVLLESENKARVQKKQVTSEYTWLDNLNEARNKNQFETMTEHDWLQFVL